MQEIIAGTYEIIQNLGHGSGGMVFLARHMRLDQLVVLKADRRKLSAGAEMLRREVDVLKQLKHKYIPQVYDFFIEDGIVYTVMEYIQGESLDKPLKRGERFPQAQIIQWATEILDALIYIHSPTHGNPPHGYIHSDIKPANIMRTPENDVCLIDFNIALAVGENSAIGLSAGYASPEHYGLDYSTDGDLTATAPVVDGENLNDKTLTAVASIGSTPSPRRTVPDVRSDIYSLGATLYHLLSGQRPNRDARLVVPLDEKQYNKQLVAIIAKAMNPNPDLRYQTAAEMQKAFFSLRENDPRVKRWKRGCIIAGSFAAALFCLGIFCAFIGLSSMRQTENWLKNAEYAQTALLNGDTQSAIEYALDALPKEESQLSSSALPQAQTALAQALGVYDLSDGFKKSRTFELPSNPLYIALSPNGDTVSCIYSEALAIIDTQTTDVLATMPVDASALNEVEYLDNETIVFAGADGICAYSISTSTVIWTGELCTAICVSQDGSVVAAVYKDESKATIYQAHSGKVIQQVDFQGKQQSVTVNDIFANPQDNLFALNENGTMLAVSFSDGSLEVFDLTEAGNHYIILDSTSGYTHFEGGFYETYFAFSATKESESVFAVIDMTTQQRTGGFAAEGYFGVAVDANGIYVQTANLLVKIHPETGEQTPLVETADAIYRFAVSEEHTVVTTKGQMQFFNVQAQLLTRYQDVGAGDYIQLCNGIAVFGSIDTPVVSILRFENHEDVNVFQYPTENEHDELRISADGETIMLFSYKQFSIYRRDGTRICKQEIPDAEQVYDQQFVRTENESTLCVTYNNGFVRTYSAKDGSLLKEEQQQMPDLSLQETFETNLWRVEAPLHGAALVYDKQSDELIRELSEDGYLTYMTQIGDNVLAQYITVDGYFYGVLLNASCEEIARLPYVCDVYNDTIYFDYPTGNMRASRVYHIEELVQLAQGEQESSGGN